MLQHRPNATLKVSQQGIVEPKAKMPSDASAWQARSSAYTPPKQARAPRNHATL